MWRLLFLTAVAAICLGQSPAQRLIALNGTCSAVAPLSGGTYDTNTLASWSTQRASIVNNGGGLSPNCIPNATSVVEDTSNNTHDVYFQVVSSWLAQPTTLTFYVKTVIGSRSVVMYIDSSSFASDVHVTVNPQSCAITDGPTADGTWTSPSATVRRIGGGWCKVTLTITIGVDTSLYINPFLASGITASYQGDGVSSISIWGVDIR